jgi:hypothetical protein
MNRLSVLATVTLSVWTLIAVPGSMWLGGTREEIVSRGEVSLIAAFVCLLPASLTLVLIDRMRKRAPVEKVVATLLAPFIRMILAGGGGVALYYNSPLIHANGLLFITWIVVFYLVTLAVETRLLYINTTDSATAEPSNR